MDHTLRVPTMKDPTNATANLVLQAQMVMGSVVQVRGFGQIYFDFIAYSFAR